MANISSIALREGARVLLASGNVFIDLSGASFQLWGQGSPFGPVNARHRIEAMLLGDDDASCMLITQKGVRYLINVRLLRDIGRRNCVTVSVSDDDGNWVGEIIEHIGHGDEALLTMLRDVAGQPCLLN